MYASKITNQPVFMTPLKLNLANEFARPSFWDIYISAVKQGPQKYNKVVYAITSIYFLSVVLLFAIYLFGIRFDPEEAPAFALLLSATNTALYCLITRFYEGSMAGHTIGVTKLNDFGFSRFASIVSLVALFLFFSFYLLSIHFNYRRGEIWGMSLIIVLILATISWKFHYYHNIWVGTEKEAREELDDYSFSKLDLDRYIEELKNRGMIR
jgi:hypothetical protein